MLDLKFIRENPDKVKEAILLKNEKGDVDRVLELDQERRKVIFEVENLKKERNENSNLVAQFKKDKKDASELIQKTKKISADIFWVFWINSEASFFSFLNCATMLLFSFRSFFRFSTSNITLRRS